MCLKTVNSAWSATEQAAPPPFISIIQMSPFPRWASSLRVSFFNSVTTLHASTIALTPFSGLAAWADTPLNTTLYE